MKRKLKNFFIVIGNMSFSIYLFHPQIISDILSLYNPIQWYFHLILLLMVMSLTVICSKIHLMVVHSVLKSNIFQKIELLFIE